MTKPSKNQRSILGRICDRLKPRKAVRAPAAPTKPPQPRKGNVTSSFEMLEGRIAPAILLNPSTITFQDLDGDLVTVKFSKPLFTATGAALDTVLNGVFKFSAGGFGNNATPQQLQLIDLTVIPLVNGKNPASGTSISVTAAKTSTPAGLVGNDLTNIGYIKAATSTTVGIPLGKVVVDGDLGQIDAGSPAAPVGIAYLGAKSMGAQGLGTQTGTASLESNVTGAIGTVKIDGNFVDATFKVIDGTAATSKARVGSLIIGGKLATSAGNSAPNAGLISVAGNINAVKIGTSVLTDGIFGGVGANSGQITATGAIKSITVVGSVVGGAGDDSGEIKSTGKMTTLRIEGELRGGAGKKSGYVYAGGAGTMVIGKTIIGGSNDDAGAMEIRGALGSLTVKNAGGATAAIAAGTGKRSGGVTVYGSAGTIFLNGSLDGSTSVLENAGRILVLGNLTTFSATGSLKGGTGATTGALLVEGKITSAKIGTSASHGIFGGVGANSGEIDTAGTIKSLVVTGSIVGGAGDESGRIYSDGAITKLAVNGELRGGDGKSSGRISVAGLGNAVIGKTIIGGSKLASGGMEVRGKLGSLLVKNSGNATAAILAGTGQQSGSITVSGNAGSISLTGSLDGTPAILDNAGSIQVLGNLGKFLVAGSLKGGGKSATGSLFVDGDIGSFRVGGNLAGGAGEASGSVAAGGKITSATVTGSLTGGAGGESGSLRAGADPLRSGDLVKVVVGGTVTGNLGNSSGSIHATGKITSAVIGPKAGPGFVPSDRLKGGVGDQSGTIIGDSGISSISIRGHVTGGAGEASGSIQANAFIKTLGIVGGLKGGAGIGSGAVVVHDLNGLTDSTPGNLGTVSISHAIAGGAGQNSGQVHADGSLGSLKAGGLSGQAVDGSGSIRIGEGVAALIADYNKIGNAGSITIAGSISKAGSPGPATIDVGGSITSLKVSGSISGAVITVGRSLGTLSVGKVGAVSEVTNTTVSALRHQTPTKTTNVAIGTINIIGNVTDSQFLAGYDRFGSAADGSAQIKNVTVSGAWKGSSAVAGVVDTAGDGFANADDAIISDKSSTAIASIAKILVKGQVLNSALSAHFGFVSDKLLSVRLLGSTVLANGDISGTNGSVRAV
jgi:hypothetical protein